MHALGGARGAHRGGERGGLVAGGGIVQGDAGGEPRVGVAALERPRDREMQLGALAGQQVVLDDLAQQGVAEAVVAVVVGDDDVAGDRLAQRTAQGGGIELAGLGQQRVVQAPPDSEHAHDLLSVLAEALDADHERVAQGGGQRVGPALEAGGEQLLHVQRVALGRLHRIRGGVGGRNVHEVQ